ncbi:MAG: type II toxin-antitoxin system prevent-host-death family antitoxin [Polyangia bacterium]
MMVSISEAKANLSKLVNRAHNGERIVISKNDLPLVEIVKHVPDGKRKLGLLAGKLDLSDDLTGEDSEVNELFYESTKEDDR